MKVKIKVMVDVKTQFGFVVKQGEEHNAEINEHGDAVINIDGKNITLIRGYNWPMEFIISENLGEINND